MGLQIKKKRVCDDIYLILCDNVQGTGHFRPLWKTFLLSFINALKTKYSHLF